MGNPPFSIGNASSQFKGSIFHCYVSLAECRFTFLRAKSKIHKKCEAEIHKLIQDSKIAGKIHHFHGYLTHGYMRSYGKS